MLNTHNHRQFSAVSGHDSTFQNVTFFSFFILSINLYSQSLERIQFENITQKIDSLITYSITQYLHIESKILNKNGRDIGYSNDNFYWTQDSLLKITTEYWTWMNRKSVTIYYNFKLPVYYQINRKKYTKMKMNPKKIFKIDCAKDEKYEIKINKVKVLSKRKAIITYSKN